jgi:hypothetical protein
LNVGRVQRHDVENLRGMLAVKIGFVWNTMKALEALLGE